MSAKYRTKQREQIEAYMQEKPGVHMTAEEIAAHFSTSGSHIGLSTVYRQMQNMIHEGVVRKYIIDENSPACFAYTGQDLHSSRPSCYHCKCEECGRLIHMECGEIIRLQEHLKEHHGFSLDPSRTVFWGLCSDCARNRKDAI